MLIGRWLDRDRADGKGANLYRAEQQHQIEVEQFSYPAFRQVRHMKSNSWDKTDQLLADQPVQGITHRRDADTEILGKASSFQAKSHWPCAYHQTLANGLVGGFSDMGGAQRSFPRRIRECGQHFGLIGPQGVDGADMGRNFIT